MNSLWKQTSDLPGFPQLDRDIKSDVLIIGGGMAGVLCAYLLHQAGVPYVLAEASTLCSGISGNTTAKITSQHGLIYDKLIRTFGLDRARQYLRPTSLPCTNTGSCAAAWTAALKKRMPMSIPWMTGEK